MVYYTFFYAGCFVTFSLIKLKLDFVNKNQKLRDFQEKFLHKKWYQSVITMLNGFYIEKKLLKAWISIEGNENQELVLLIKTIDVLVYNLFFECLIDKNNLKAFFHHTEMFHMLFMTHINPELKKISTNHYFEIRAHDFHQVVKLIKNYKIELKLSKNQDMQYPIGSISYLTMNINAYPTVRRDLEIPVNAITIGDLHGNVHKLMHFLFTKSIIEISEVNFLAFQKYYHTLLSNFFHLPGYLSTIKKQELLDKISENFTQGLNLISTIQINDSHTLKSFHQTVSNPGFLFAGIFEGKLPANSFTNLRTNYFNYHIPSDELRKIIIEHRQIKRCIHKSINENLWNRNHLGMFSSCEENPKDSHEMDITNFFNC